MFLKVLFLFSRFIGMLTILGLMNAVRTGLPVWLKLLIVFWGFYSRFITHLRKKAIECLQTVPREKKVQFQNTRPIHLQVSEAFEEVGILQWRPVLFNGTLYAELNEMAEYSTAQFVIHFHWISKLILSEQERNSYFQIFIYFTTCISMMVMVMSC